MFAMLSVLAVYANPRGEPPLSLDREHRALSESIRLSRHSASISLQARWATRIADLRRAFLDEQFEVVHFSGHSSVDGLLLEDEYGRPFVLAPDVLAELLGRYSPPIICVVLNACFTSAQAETLATSVPYVVAMNADISDRGALEFARGFYDAIGAGRDIASAYEEGCSNLRSLRSPDAAVPVLFRRPADHR